MKVQNLFFLKMLVLLFSAILKKFGGLISNVMSPIESKNPHPLSPLGVKPPLFLFLGGKERKLEEYLTWPAMHLRNITYSATILHRENQNILLWHEARVRL